MKESRNNHILRRRQVKGGGLAKEVGKML